ncbi:hypothetical protein GQ53DRAFT_838755 [Thozetella sp. PMI_491]|nr:hypothetical protein GQ53DRAFT_838755 [Thozetella sp. PMI_491]
MASESAPADVEGQSRAQEQEKPTRTQEPTGDIQQQERQHQAPLPPTHQKVQFQQEPPRQPVPPPPQFYPQYAQTQPLVFPYSHGWHRAKLALYTLSILICGSILGLGIYISSASSYLSLIEFGLLAALSAGALVWTALEFLILCSTRDDPPRGIHPGAHVAVHLIIWIYGAIVMSFMGIFVSDQNDYYYSSRYHPSVIWEAEKALLGLTAVLAVIHFVLFVRACVETHQRNNTAQRTTIYVPVAMNPDGSYGNPYGYYAQPQGTVPIPPEVARQMAASGQAHLVPGQVPPPAGYYAPAPPVTTPAPAQGNSALYGYYAPQPSMNPQPAMPPRTSMRQPAPPGPSSVSSVGPSTVSPAPDRTPHSPPTAPSPVSTR